MAFCNWSISGNGKDNCVSSVVELLVSSSESVTLLPIPPTIILLFFFLFKSILLISALNLSSCALKALRTVHTTLYLSLSSNASSGFTPDGTTIGIII